MEKWQKEHVEENLRELVTLTTCGTTFLSELAVFLSNDDRALLDATLQSKGKLEQSRLLYDVAVKKPGMYEAITKALFESAQTGALQIFLKGALKHRPDSVLGTSALNPQQLEQALVGLKENALECLVIIQGHEVSLQETLQSLGETVVQRLIEKYLDGKLLVDLVCNKRPVLINNSAIPDSLPYYIYRRLTTRHYLDPAIFNHRCNDVFVVNRIQLNDLCTLARNQDTDFSSNQLESLTVRFIVLEYEEEYEEICKLSPKEPVHLIDHNSGRYTWIKTTGDISTMQRFVNESQHELTEENFLHSCLLSSRPVCISDTPGMGKTVLLTSLANRVLQIHPRHLLRFIVLREFVPIVQERGKDNIDKELLIDIISEQASDFEFGREVVKELLISEEKVVVLMFDGFDEVLFNQVKTAKTALKILSELKAVRLYVATRPHMRDELEESLGTLGYNILAFGKNEQAECLTKYWEQHKAFKGRNLEEFAEKCLEALEKNMKDSERDIAGIPLQCKMLAEVYQNDAIKYSKPERRSSEIVVVKITSIFDMYQKLVDLRFERIKPINNAKNRKRSMMLAHMYAALKLLFPDFGGKFRNMLVCDGDKIKVHELCYLGILEKKKTNVETPRFIHRTFAEYFLGLFTVRMLLFHDDFGMQASRKEFLEFFVNTVLLTAETKKLLLNSCKLGKFEFIKSATFQYQVICYFVNAHLKNCSENRLGKSQWTTAANTTKLYNVLAACIVHDYPVLFHRTSEEPKTFPQIFLTKSNLAHLSLLSAKYASLELFKAVHSNVMKYANEQLCLVGLDSKEFFITPLHVAVERGLFSIVNFYINSYSSFKLQQLKYVLHCCVAGSIRDDAMRIKNKIEIIKLITRTFPDWLDEQMPNGLTPLLQRGVHVKLLEELLNVGANVNVSNKDGCVIHSIVANDILPDNFSDFVLDLVVKHEFHSFNTIDTNNRTPLHAILEKVDLNDEVIQLFHLMAADFNAVDNTGNSILFYAVRGHRSVGVLKCLLSFGAKMEQLNFNHDNIFHVCSKFGNYIALQHFLKQQHGDTTLINALNRSNTTPIILALQRGKSVPIHIIHLLEDNGLNVTHKVASDALKAFICNKYIMAWELGDNFVVVADHLLKKGGAVICKDEKNPWELEATKKNMQKIIQSTLYSDALLLEMEKRGVTGLKGEAKQDSTAIYKESLLSKLRKRHVHSTKSLTQVDQLESLYLKLQAMQNSFERLCISLICCNQIRPFMLLKQCLQTDMQGTLKFVSPPNGLTEFIHSEEEQVVVLRSWDTELSMTRIKNTIDSDANLITDETFETIRQSQDLTVYHCKNVTAETLQKAASLKVKTICLVNFAREICFPHLTQVLTDELAWNDLASEFQNKLLLPYRVRNDVRGIPDQKIYLQLKNNGLIIFIHEQENSQSELGKKLEKYKQDFLNTSQVFQLCISPDFTITPLHVAVKRGHSLITEYLLNSTSYSKVQCLKYLVHCCVAETVNDSESTIAEKVTILKLLHSFNKHWIDEHVSNDLPPLLQTKVHEKLVECLLKCGADITAAVLCGKEISLLVISILEKEEILITQEVASKILQGLFCNSNLNEWDLKTDFIRVCDYLLKVGGVLRCRNDKNPWELEAIQKNIQHISEATKCSHDFLVELKRRGIFLQDDLVCAEAFHSKIMSSHKPSFEQICLSLLSCHQIKPFITMKLCLETDIHHHKFFVTIPKGIPEFFAAKEGTVFVLRSFDVGLSIMRLKDTVDPNLALISKWQKIMTDSKMPLIVFICDHVSKIKIEYLAAFERKVICVCTSIEDSLDTFATVSEDEISWEDFSADLQHDLMDFEEGGVPQTVSKLHNLELVKFLRENFPQFVGFETNKTVGNNDCSSSNIFQHFLCEKIVFHGISRTELNQFVKFGHIIGEIGDDISKLDYVLVQSCQQFQEVCKQTTATVHLLVYDKGTLKLVQTRGSDKNIKKFIKEKQKQVQCDDFPVCTCGNHKVGSGNLIWNVFHYPGKLQTSWVNILNLIEPTNTKDSFKIGNPSLIADVTNVFSLAFNAKNNLECWRQTRDSIVCSYLDNQSIHSADVIVELLKFVGCEDNERVELQQIAAKMLFPKFVERNQVSSPTIDKFVQLGILGYSSICELVGFVHRVFTWYFVSDMVIIEQPSQLVLDIRQEILHDCFEAQDVEVSIRIETWYYWVSKTIKTFRFVQATFFRFLDRLADLKPTLVLGWVKVHGTNDFLTKWINASIVGNYSNLFNVIFSLGVDREIFKSEDLVTLAVMYADVPIIEVVFTMFEQNTNKKIFDIRLHDEELSSHDNDIPQSVLHVAARRGSFVVMDFLLNNKAFQHRLIQPIMMDLLVLSVYDTKKNHDQVTNRKRMIRALLENDETWINKRNTTTFSPFLFKHIHVDLIIYLINIGFNIHAVDKDAHNVLHICPEYMNPGEYHKLIQTLAAGENSKIFHARDKGNCTPLHFAVKYLELLDSTLQLFVSAKVDLNAKNKYGNTPLIWAVINKRSLRLMESLINYGTNFHELPQHNTAVLHIAAEFGNLSALRYFISRRWDVNAKDKNGDTPLHRALKFSSEHTHDIVQILVKNSADVNAITNLKHTPLSLALEWKNKVEHRTKLFLRSSGALV